MQHSATAMPPGRLPRLAFLELPGLTHFLPDLAGALAASGALHVRRFSITSPADLAAAMAWTDRPAIDALWFEFCWPPFPMLLSRTDFGGRRVIVRVHRIEAYELPHVANTNWAGIEDCITVSADMARIVREAAPAIDATTRLTVLHNGVDTLRFVAGEVTQESFRLGWCGNMIPRKNPTLALEILARLRADEPRWRLHIASSGGDRLVADAMVHLVPRMGLDGAVVFDGAVPQAAMPAWHARNTALLSTSLHESFGYAIAEAAAAGCDLAVLDHRGAEEFWPAAMRFTTVEEAVALLRDATPGRWRDWVAQRFPLERQVAEVLALLHTPRRAMAVGGMRMALIAHGAWRGRLPLRDASDHIQRSVLATGGFYEAAMLEDLRQRLPQGGLFVDVGANIGNHGLFAAGVCGARVLAFEPSPELAAHCVETFAANGLEASLDLRRQGVGAAPGQATLHPGPTGNAGMTSLDTLAEGGVEIIRLDDAVHEAPAVVKIDVEGMEYAVLEGAQEVLQRWHPVLYVETGTEASFVAVSALLGPLGYRPRKRFNATPTWLFLPGVV